MGVWGERQLRVSRGGSGGRIEDREKSRSMVFNTLCSFF